MEEHCSSCPFQTLSYNAAFDPLLEYGGQKVGGGARKFVMNASKLSLSRADLA